MLPWVVPELTDTPVKDDLQFPASIAVPVVVSDLFFIPGILHAGPNVPLRCRRFLGEDRGICRMRDEAVLQLPLALADHIWRHDGVVGREPAALLIELPRPQEGLHRLPANDKQLSMCFYMPVHTTYVRTS